MTQESVEPSNLVNIPQARLYRMVNGIKTLQACDTLRLEKPKPTQVSISVADFRHRFTSDDVFFKVTHKSEAAYFFTVDKESLHAVVFPNTSPEFQEQINKITEIYAYDKAKSYHMFQELIRVNYPDSSVQVDDSKSGIPIIQKVGDIIGNGFKAMGAWTAYGVNSLGQSIQARVAPSSLSPSTQQKLDTLNDKSKVARETIVSTTKAIAAPVMKTGADVSQQISSSMENSSYSSIRKAHGVAQSSVNAGVSILKGMWAGLRQFGSALSTQSKNIWRKRYGGHLDLAEVGGSQGSSSRQS